MLEKTQNVLSTFLWKKICYKTILIVNGVHRYDYRGKYVAEYNSPKEIILQTLWNLTNSNQCHFRVPVIFL